MRLCRQLDGEGKQVMAFNKDYEEARDHFSLSAVKAMAQLGNDRATQRFLGAIDALTEAVFVASGGPTRGAIGLAIDNTKPTDDLAA